MNLKEFLEAQERMEKAKEDLHQATIALENLAKGLSKTIFRSGFWTQEEVSHHRWMDTMSKIFTYGGSMWEIVWTPSVIKGRSPSIHSLKKIPQAQELKTLPE